MSSVKEPQGSLTTVPPGSRELVQKVAASTQFQKSKRLRDLLLYLGEHSLRGRAISCWTDKRNFQRQRRGEPK